MGGFEPPSSGSKPERIDLLPYITKMKIKVPCGLSPHNIYIKQYLGFICLNVS